MNIAIFQSITTDEQIKLLEEKGASYEGLYVDMDDAPQRKYVKDNAELIQKLIRDVDRKRINESKDYKNKVEAEAKSIIDRLKVANEPFTLLIDTHKTKRAKELSDEKRVVELRELAIQKELDHEMALLIDKTFAFDKAELIRIKHEQDEQYRIDAEVRAAANQSLINEGIERDRIHAENARLANVEHVRGVNISILNVLTLNGLSENDAKMVVGLIVKKQLPNVTINY